ncbi:ATP-binding protein [Kitasatospora sp. NPDC059747]|uniref:ATP-binding protein n=1 Tax=Kitasatospora sp. NPDC059747 TaxID=3346930 RepID=UPI0036510A80
MPNEPSAKGDWQSNRIAGSAAARDVVQAHDVHGGIHFHQPLEQRSFSVRPNQLPYAGGRFINRSGELGSLDRMADGGGEVFVPSAVVVVTGTAGVGKTSLALHWAHRVRDRFPAGALYVNLRGHDANAPVSPGQVLDRFLRDLGLPAAAVPVGLEDRASLYRSMTADRRLLVLLDNAATAAQVRPLLPGAAGSLTLVTSRNSLPGLVAREGADRLDLARFPDAEAVLLLRAVTAASRTADRPDELAELARLCAGLPLALRIAAERAAGRPLMLLCELIAELKDRSALWEVLTAETEEETDAMHHVFAWSYRALPEAAARQFRLLGLHPGDEFGLPAAAALAGSTLAEARRRLDVLTGAHLVEECAPGRYRLHDLLRAYAVTQVQETESAEARRDVRRRVLSWYLHTADNAQSALARFDRYALDLPVPADVVPLAFDDHPSALRWYRAEVGNLVAAVRAAAETGCHDLAWRLAVVLRAVFMHQNAFEDWVTTAGIGIGSAARDGSRAGEAEAYENLGKAYFQSRRLDEAEECHRAALEIRRRTGDRFGEAVSVNALGLLGLRRRRLDEARSCFEAGAAIFADLSERRWAALLLSNLAETRCELGDFRPAAEALERALAVFRELGDRSGEGNALHFLGWARRGLGSLAGARAAAEAALAIATQEGNDLWEAHWLVGLAHVERAAGRPGEALRACERAVDVQRRLGDRSREATALDGAGEACRDLGRTDDAIRLHEAAARIHRECADQWQLSGALDNLARALGGAGREEEARRHRTEALALLAGFDDPRAAERRERIGREGTGGDDIGRQGTGGEGISRGPTP